MSIYERIDLYKHAIGEHSTLQGKMFNQIKDYYRISLTWSSNALEGNTLTESETKVLLEDGLTVGGKPLKYTFEALGHAKAYDFMFTLLNSKEITESDILTMHSMFYKDIEPEYAGKYRDIEVIITGSKYPVCKPSEIQNQMKEFFKWIKIKRIDYNPVVFAAQIHKRFVFIHPFKDGNGRISRLIMNAALIQAGYTLAIIPPILRAEYIELLEKAHIDDKPFETFIAERVLESQKDMMRLLHIDLP